MRTTKAFSILIFVFSVCLVHTCYAQTSKGKVTIDSSKNLTRKQKIKFPLTPDTKVLPLNWYNFNAQISATFTFSDSLHNITSKTTYNYYFDKGSDYVAFKEMYEWKNKVRSSFRLEELKDSIAFKASLDDTAKTLSVVKIHVFQPGNGLPVQNNNHTPAYVKQGSTKVINGYLCESYVMDNEQFTNTIWVTADKDPFLEKVRHDLRFSVYSELTTSGSGIVMASECYYKQTKHTQRFEVTAVNKNAPRRVVMKGMRLVRGW